MDCAERDTKEGSTNTWSSTSEDNEKSDKCYMQSKKPSLKMILPVKTL